MLLIASHVLYVEKTSAYANLMGANVNFEGVCDEGPPGHFT